MTKETIGGVKEIPSAGPELDRLVSRRHLHRGRDAGARDDRSN